MSSYLDLLGSSAVNWGADDEISKDDISLFDRLRGVHHPYGSPVPKPLAAGKRYFSEDGNTEFAITTDTGQSDWGDYQPGAGFRSVGTAAGQSNEQGRTAGLRIWQRKGASAPAASPAPAAEAPAALNTAKINEAYERASKARKAWQDHAPRQDFSLNPIERAADFGRNILAGQPLYSDYAKEKAGADATAIGEITQNALANFQGAVPKYDDPKALADYYINRFNA